MSSEPLVSILIPAYNAEKYLESTLLSCINQTWKNIEVVIVNDGSSDSTLAIANKYKSDKVKVINQTNKGASASRNIAFEQSKGDYIQYLDADDILDVDKINSQLKLIKQHGNEYIYSSYWIMMDEMGQLHKEKENPLFQKYIKPVDWLITAWTKKCWMQPSAWLTPRNLISSAGTWNEELSLHDDGEFFSRVLLKSKGIFYCQEAKSYYRKGLPNSLSSIISEKAIISHLKICNLYTSHLLSVENSIRTKAACADNFQNFIYTYYPQYKKYTKIAKQRIKELGGSNAKISGDKKFIFLTKFLGWKSAKLIQILYQKIRNG